MNFFFCYNTNDQIFKSWYFSDLFFINSFNTHLSNFFICVEYSELVEIETFIFFRLYLI